MKYLLWIIFFLLLSFDFLGRVKVYSSSPTRQAVDDEYLHSVKIIGANTELKSIDLFGVKKDNLTVNNMGWPEGGQNYKKVHMGKELILWAIAHIEKEPVANIMYQDIQSQQVEDIFLRPNDVFLGLNIVEITSKTIKMSNDTENLTLEIFSQE